VETAEHIRSVLKDQSRGASIQDDYVNELLAALEPDEEVLWSVSYANMQQKFGPLAMLTVTSRRLISQESAGRSGNSMAELTLDDVLSALDMTSKPLFGLMTRHELHVLTTAGHLVWKDLPDASVAAAVDAIDTAKAATAA
jgi:hypothetical protein